MTGQQALLAAAARLAAAGVVQPATDARRLLAHAMGIPPERLTLHLAEAIDTDAEYRFERMLAARGARQPVSQIIGFRGFWGRDFLVTRDVLDPRPETETLIAEALERPFDRVLDLGTGSGAILITLLAERPAASGTGVDVSAAALAVARDNADRLGVSARATLLQSDWFEAISGPYDLIVANPPYISETEMESLAPEVRDWEPHVALTPGGDGLGAYRAITAGALRHLAEGGRMIVEIGPSQGIAVARLFRAAGLTDIRVHPDLDGRDRIVSGISP